MVFICLPFELFKGSYGESAGLLIPTKIWNCGCFLISSGIRKNGTALIRYAPLSKEPLNTLRSACSLPGGIQENILAKSGCFPCWDRQPTHRYCCTSDAPSRIHTEPEIFNCLNSILLSSYKVHLPGIPMPRIRLYLSILSDCRNMTLFLFSLPMDDCVVPSEINAFNNYLNNTIFLSKLQYKIQFFYGNQFSKILDIIKA